MTDIVQVRMRENTIHQLDQIQKRVGSPSRSDAVRRSIEFYDLLINAVEHGERIVIEGRDGEKRQLIISGLERTHA